MDSTPAAAAASLSSRRVLVTGGLGALGRAVGDLLAERGARVVLLDRAPAHSLPGMAGVLGDVDLGDQAAAAAALEQACSLLGGLDSLVNVAGGFRWETLEGGSVESWDALYGMNLRSAVVASRAALPYLLAAAPAAIVNVGALAANKAALGMGAYAASKAGVARLTEALAEELKDRGVRVNAVLPSILDTPANRADMPDADFARWVHPQALATVIAFLLSDDAQAVTGACIPVAGRV
ncbi:MULTISPECIES: SDR family NAD(P)-dependent oxidoreductase [Azohydromonas]|uniref:SDR family NAD(P)-dependent oxidoreductase n=1 Tax=Azohydromonas lata TaxID=45677 RepID=A0ABU5IB42_9BURK|nr:MULTISPECIES: SDR family NAD(P)-dependent oxidoreductase [Azohydromonas]MDZ5455193.1 SDR family NAD(P)-dependent oxidoreductase [Azohydromonas lata]